MTTTEKAKKPLTMNRWLQANPRNSKHGAPMGTRDDLLDPEVPVHVEKLDWIDDDYLRDGTYFGRSSVHGDIYALWQEQDDDRRAVYIRAKSRNRALAEVADLGLTALRPY